MVFTALACLLAFSQPNKAGSVFLISNGQIMRALLRRLGILIAWFLALGFTSSVAAEGPRYCANAHRYLEHPENIDCPHLAYCIRLNNYGCVKQRAQPMPGTIGQDNRRHAIFSEPTWSLAMMIARFQLYGSNGRVSALQIMEKYSPWCDTQGSIAIKGGWGRTCSDNPHPPQDFSGPLCKRPAGSQPLPHQCEFCNCPTEVAARLLEGTGKRINDPLDLFATEDEPVLRKIMTRLIFQETSQRPNSEALDEGIRKFRHLSGSRRRAARSLVAEH
jgi:hypothetical protein